LEYPSECDVGRTENAVDLLLSSKIVTGRYQRYLKFN